MSGFSEILWFEQGGLPLLAILQLLPLCGAAVVFAFKERTTAVVAGKAFALAELLLCIVVASRINPASATLQLAERFDPLGYHVAVDGLSIVFLLVAALLTVLMTFYGMSRGMISPGRLFAVLLVAELGPDGVRSRAGGMVVKNVTGYDMMHLHYAAMGALGVVSWGLFHVLKTILTLVLVGPME